MLFGEVMMLTETVKATLLAYQRDELTEYHIYLHLAARQPEGGNKDIRGNTCQ